jgi:hypothetical protein
VLRDPPHPTCPQCGPPDDEAAPARSGIGLNVRSAGGPDASDGRRPTDSEGTMASVLDGIRVLDLSSGIAGPITGMLLADHGADVVKVEPPGGDPLRGSPGYDVWLRGPRPA